MTESSPIPPGERSGHRIAGGPIADPRPERGGGVLGRLDRVDGVDCYRIDGVDQLDPFLMTVTSSSDLWMFISSRGSLTAGRTSADRALFPYETDDRIHRAVGITGPVTVLARSTEGRRELWRPFGPDPDGQTRQSLSKSLQGDRVVFEEVHEEWGVTFRAIWVPAPSFGWVRRVELQNHGDARFEVEVLDGLLDVMPAGVDSLLEQIRSNLVDAYKRSETGRWGTSAIYTLEARITDRAEPAESLEATLVWSDGAPWAEIHMDERVLRSTLEGRDLDPTRLLTGRRGSYLLRGRLSVEPGSQESWVIVAEPGLDQAALHDRIEMLATDDVRQSIEVDVAAGSARLADLLTLADAEQHTGDPIADAHHLSNVLFNIMRGGVFPYGVVVPVADLLEHLGRWNREVHVRHGEAIGALGESIRVEDLRRFALGSGDPDLLRLVLEYLPLTFSRRHGDPSRPWNRFSIRRSGIDGENELGYEGNWRDIFQNWEALLLSYPSYLPNVVGKFVNASTVDGHNPYRISQDGFEWEAPDPHDPWSNIGYWGDHQVVYLHRLLAAWERVEPGAIGRWLDHPVFVYADVPYVLASYPEMVDDPRNTIAYDQRRAETVANRVSRIGSDGRLCVNRAGDLVRVGLMEKLLVPVLAKLTSFVPGGGIWLNTQRPEWNDANNALAGFGLSMVTLYHLYGYLVWLRSMVESQMDGPVGLSTSVADWLSDVTAALERVKPDVGEDDRLRRSFMDEMGDVGTRYRAAVTAEFDDERVSVEKDSIERLLVAAIEHLSHTIAGSRRADGLYDAYNVVAFPAPDQAIVERLGPMLEGQVAILASGALGPDEAGDLIDTLYESGIYRPDLDSFMLYPAPAVPGFLDRNTIPAQRLAQAPFMLDLGREIVVADSSGGLHFAPGMVNGEALEEALEASVLSADERAIVASVYEEVFGHHSYTGRSGSMYGYEGIGSVYWHMVGKLLLAVQETYWAARDHGAAPEVLGRLASGYRRIRAGLGFCKGPVEFGAIPIDCYSHSPAHGGAQQPGMTGQVKEEILTRFGELGLRIVGGRIVFAPGLLPSSAILAGEPEAGRFTFCGVSVSLVNGPTPQHRICRSGTWSAPEPGLILGEETSREILRRGGAIESVEFTVPSWTD